MRKWLLVLVTGLTVGMALVPGHAASASLFQTNAWIGNCIGEIDVTVTPKPSFSSLTPDPTASLQGGLSCVVATIPPGYSGPLGGNISASLGNLTPVTCAAGLL